MPSPPSQSEVHGRTSQLRLPGFADPAIVTASALPLARGPDGHARRGIMRLGAVISDAWGPTRDAAWLRDKLAFDEIDPEATPVAVDRQAPLDVDRALLGHCLLAPIDMPTAWMQTCGLVVRPSERGRGLGRLLVDAAIAAARARQAAGLRSRCEPHLLGLFAAAGFTPIHERVTVCIRRDNATPRARVVGSAPPWWVTPTDCGPLHEVLGGGTGPRSQRGRFAVTQTELFAGAAAATVVDLDGAWLLTSLRVSSLFVRVWAPSIMELCDQLPDTRPLIVQGIGARDPGLEHLCREPRCAVTQRYVELAIGF